MGAAEIALVISGFSLAVSTVSLLWNIIQKFLHVRPKVMLSFSVMNLLGDPQDRAIVALRVVNLGPGSVVLYGCVVRTKKRWREFSFPWWKLRRPWKFFTDTNRPVAIGLLTPIADNNPFVANPQGVGPFVHGLPNLKLEPLAEKTFYFPYSADTFLSEPLLDVGVNDLYQRNIWAPRKDVRSVAKRFNDDFPGRAKAP